jgi:hypothetical protein
VIEPPGKKASDVNPDLILFGVGPGWRFGALSGVSFDKSFSLYVIFLNKGKNQ